MDIYNIEKPFGLLDDETQRELVQAYEKNADMEVYTPDGWCVNHNPSFNKAVAYRAVRPATTPDIVPWEALADWVEWVARDSWGDVYAFKSEPEIMRNQWESIGRKCSGLGAVKITPGTCDWKDSLQRRPNKGETK